MRITTTGEPFVETTSKETPFVPGSVVELKSGGLPMTVIEHELKTDQVECWWMNLAGVIERSVFPAFCLEQSRPRLR
jgi:uncharacterized protein YodC (DUF2158 family)